MKYCMRQAVLALYLAMAAATVTAAPTGQTSAAKPIALAIHGGAGVIRSSDMTPEREAQYRAGLEAALDAGYAVLEGGGTSLDAVSTVVRILEDNPLFNAGRGAVLTHDGVAELDASIMDGSTLRAGAVAGVRHVKNPIDLARRVMEKSKHVMLVGTGAEEFALQQGVPLVPNSYFIIERRREQLENAVRKEREEAAQPTTAQEAKESVEDTGPKGTVGAVALDRAGNLAAATSTGGMTNKRHGRVGDSPIIGAGTYAKNGVCAVSATGTGEYFIRLSVARDICAEIEYRRISLDKAVQNVIHTKLTQLGGDGGVITLDGGGRIVMDFNTEGMFRAARDSRGKREVTIYRDK